MNEHKELSGGAEKVETIARRKRAAGTQQEEKQAQGGRAAEAQARKAMQGAAAAGGKSADANRKAKAQAKAQAKAKADAQHKAEAKEQAKAKARVALAQKKQEQKEERAKKRAERAALKQQRAEEKKKLAAERAALKQQRAEEKKKLAAERKAEAREQARVRRAQAEERAAHRRAARAEHKTQRARGRSRERKHERAPGFGGWLAAVVSLSVAVLALGAIVTVGYFDLNGAKGELSAGYQESAYEFSEAVEEMDANLVKVRIASGGELERLLADVYADSLVAESSLSAFPADGRQTAAISSAVNRTGALARQGLAKLSEGGTLGAEEREAFDACREELALIREGMPALIEGVGMGMTDGMAAESGAYVKELEKISLRLAELHPEEAQEAAAPLAEEKEVSESEAEEALRQMLAAYDIARVRAVGKEEGRLPCYAFEAEDAAGRQYYAQVTVRGAKLALLESYTPCTQNNYDASTCVEIAQNFLEGCGYEGLEAVWTSESGTECTVEFVPVQGNVLLYPDLLKVKVCRERGAVTGVAAGNYLLHHRARTLSAAAVPASRIRANAEKKMQDVSLRMALIPQAGGELLCWQVRGECEGTLYFAYVDARTGSTAEIRAVRLTDRGELPL